jgi:hypothetical protein
MKITISGASQVRDLSKPHKLTGRDRLVCCPLCGVRFAVSGNAQFPESLTGECQIPRHKPAKHPLCPGSGLTINIERR